MNILTRIYDSTRQGLRGFSENFQMAFNGHGGMPDSMAISLRGIATPDDKFTGLVFACVDAIIQQACLASPKLMHYNADGEAERQFDSPLLTLLNHPNSQQTWRDLVKWTVGYRETQGNAYWYLQPALRGNQPVQIFVLDPALTMIREKASDGAGVKVVSYQYTSPLGQVLELPGEQVISFPYFSTKSQIQGIGPLQAARIEQENYQLGDQWVNQLFKKGAMLSGILSTDQQINNDILREVRKQWKQTYAGVQNFGETAVLAGGLKYQKLSLSQQDMAFYEGREDMRKVILQIFRVPETILGSSDTVTRANADAALLSFARNKVQSMMEDIFERLNQFLVPRFGLNPTQDKLEFNNLVPEDKEFELQRMTELVETDIMLVNEARSRQGLEDLPWGDLPYSMIKSLSGGATLDDLNDKLDELANGRSWGDRRGDSDQERGDRSGTRSGDDKRARGDNPHRFDHKWYRKKTNKISDNLEKKYLPEVEKSYTEAWGVAVAEIVSQWEEVTSQKAMVGDLSEVTGKVRQPILQSLVDMITEGYFEFGDLAVEYLAGEYNDMYLDNQVAADWISEHALETASQIADTLKAEIAPYLADAITNGTNTYELTQQLTEHFEELTEWKAKQIARTEIHRALCTASDNVTRSIMADTGEEYVKYWRTAGDDSVCEICRGNEEDGWIDYKQAFSSGAMTAYDTHPNCRCRLEEEAKYMHEN